MTIDTEHLRDLFEFGIMAATAYLAYETRMLSKATQAAVAGDNIPYLAQDGYFAQQSAVGVQLGILLSNPGKRRVSYHVNRFHVVLNNATVPNPVFVVLGGFVFPSGRTTYHYPEIPGIAMPCTGTAEYDINYGLTPTTRTSRVTGQSGIDIVLVGQGQFQVRWRELQGPDYT